jgi:hypothetical protein
VLYPTAQLMQKAFKTATDGNVKISRLLGAGEVRGKVGI